MEHGAGRPVLVLHGAGVDHHETEACFESVFAGTQGYRRVYPDLPGMGRTAAPDSLRSAGHDLPHERPEVLHALVAEWLERVEAPTP